jgi:protein phosphatase
VAHIGDSRAQLLRHGTFATITLDHAAFADPDPGLARGQQDRLDAVRSLADLDDPVERAAFSSRHMLTQALTGTGELEVRTYVVPLRAGDRLLLDSDGLHDNLTAAEIAALLAPGTPQEAADSLVAADGREACIRAKPDDISALVVEPRTVGSAR